MTQPNPARGALSRAAWSGFAFGAAVPATLGMVAMVLSRRSGRWAPPSESEFFIYLGLICLGGAIAGALAALFSSWMAGPTYSARWLALVTVGAMYVGALVGSGLNRWGRPEWHFWFSFGGGAVAGVLVLVLLVLREKRVERRPT